MIKGAMQGYDCTHAWTCPMPRAVEEHALRLRTEKLRLPRVRNDSLNNEQTLDGPR